MESQESNSNSNQKAGCTIFFKNRTTQFIPDASLKELVDKLNNYADSKWLAYGQWQLQVYTVTIMKKQR